MREGMGRKKEWGNGWKTEVGRKSGKGERWGREVFK